MYMYGLGKHSTLMYPVSLYKNVKCINICNKSCFLLFFEGRLRLVTAASPKYVTIILLYFLSQ